MGIIAERITKARKELGLNQKELAKKANIAEPTLSRYENGYREPKAGTISQIAEALGISADYILGITDTIEVINKDENNLEVLKDCINKFRKRLGHNKVDEYINLLEEGKYEELVEKYLVEYYDSLYMHSVDKYKYNEVINFDNVDVAVEEVIKFHKSAMEGAIKC